MKKGRLFILIGPPAVGKNTLISEVDKRVDEFVRMPSATTRAPRPEEIPGVSKVFLSDEEFDDNIAQDQFVEWQVIHGHRYGVLKKIVQQRIDRGLDYSADVEVLGAMKLKKCYKENVVLIFVVPPSLEVLEKRIKDRNAETEEEIKIRLTRSRAELNYLPNCDYILMNDDLGKAITDLRKIVLMERGLLPSGERAVNTLTARVIFVDKDGKSVLVDKNDGSLPQIPLQSSSLAPIQISLYLQQQEISFEILKDKQFTYEHNKGLDMAQPLWVNFDSTDQGTKVEYLFVVRVSSQIQGLKQIPIEQMWTKEASALGFNPEIIRENIFKYL